jgi:type I restriction enzyme, R subunit
MKGIMGWVRLHPHNIASRVQIVVEHFRENVAYLLGGQAKAMVVTSSRKEAVRWMTAMQKYITARGYTIGLLVAFSGEVEDKETGPDPFTESNMNPGMKGRDIREAFNTPEYSILLVANKFQTGFDQPLLAAMYVDKRLGGIQAVQTLSRLNRAYPGKDTTYVVDFVNDSEEILNAFKAYHTTAELAAVTDPTMLLDLRAKLDSLAYYDTFEVDRVVKVSLKAQATQKELDAAIAPVANRLLIQYRNAKAAFTNAPEGSTEARQAKDTMDALLLFKKDMGTFNRFYAFLSQMFDYGNTDLEKRFIFFRLLSPLLEFGREREGIDLSALQLTHHTLRDLGQQRLNLGHGEAPKIEPEQPGGGTVQDKQKAQLEEIIQRVNDLFAGDLTETDRLVYVDKVIKGKLLESKTLQEQAANNTKEQFSNSPDLDGELMNAIMDALAAHQVMSKQALDSNQVRAGIKEILLGPGGLWEGLRDAGITP